MLIGGATVPEGVTAATRGAVSINDEVYTSPGSPGVPLLFWSISTPLALLMCGPTVSVYVPIGPCWAKWTRNVTVLICSIELIGILPDGPVSEASAVLKVD